MNRKYASNNRKRATIEEKAAVCLHYDIDELKACFYGEAAYIHLGELLGPDLLKDVLFFSGDDYATLSGLARTFVVALVGPATQISDIRAILEPTVGSPLKGVSGPVDEPLVRTGYIDPNGRTRSFDDGGVMLMDAIREGFKARKKAA